MSTIHCRDKIVLVTGGSRGIGEAMATALCESGARVAIASRKQDGVEAAAARIREAVDGAQVEPFVAHMGKPALVQELVADVEDRFGPLDAVINNAATNPYFGPMIQIDGGAYDKTFEVNTRGYFELARAAARSFVANRTKGSIVNVSSVAGIRGAPLQGVYGMTKAAVISMTQTLAIELGGSGIRVNAIAPGLVETKFASALVQNREIVNRIVEKTPLQRYAQPSELGGAAVFLVSDASSFVTGHTLVVDGGMTIGGL
jgi:NAD(P)-dependent dehydrogenase (short-subunit alcohol dehydrogenase family)